MTTLAHPKRLNQIDVALPGKIGSVGDTINGIRLKQSAPEMPIRFDAKFFNRPDNGSLVTGQPYTFDSAWNMGRQEQTAYGLMQQDLRAPDKLHEPTLGVVPQYEWRNKVATVYTARTHGDKFLPLPGPYNLAVGEMPRGGQVVRVTDMEDFSSNIISEPVNENSSSTNLVSNRPAPNLVNGSKNYTFMAPKSGFGSSTRFTKV
jgi:hypothetical protein